MLYLSNGTEAKGRKNWNRNVDCVGFFFPLCIFVPFLYIFAQSNDRNSAEYFVNGNDVSDVRRHNYAFQLTRNWIAQSRERISESFYPYFVCVKINRLAILYFETFFNDIVFIRIQFEHYAHTAKQTHIAVISYGHFVSNKTGEDDSMREYVCRVKREVGKSKSAWNREKCGYWCFSSVRISSNGKWEKKDEAEDEKMPKLSESRKATRKWKNKCQKYVRTRSLSLIHSFQRNSFESSLDTWLSAQHTLSAFYRFLVEISTVGFLNMNQHESALTRIKCKWKNKEKKK